MLISGVEKEGRDGTLENERASQKPHQLSVL